MGQASDVRYKPGSNGLSIEQTEYSVKVYIPLMLGALFANFFCYVKYDDFLYKLASTMPS